MPPTEFTHETALEIKGLLDKRLTADRTRQKSIRAKIRRLGFYISDYKNGFSSNDFDQLLRTGEIVIKGQGKSDQVRPGPRQVPLTGGEGHSFGVKRKAKDENHKLLPLAQMIAKLLYDKFGVAVTYRFEVSHNWLPSTPTPSLCMGKHTKLWQSIETVYCKLVDNKWTLDSKLEEFAAYPKTGHQIVDVWYEEPYKFVFEFDEGKHFNQFRLATLDHYPDYVKPSLDKGQYRCLSERKVVKPGVSGFQKLTSWDPLFPDMYDGDKQDNRHRQRAFRDFLKDILPDIVGANPTVRLSYKTTNGRTEGFNADDVEAARQLIQANKWLDRIVMKG